MTARFIPILDMWQAGPSRADSSELGVILDEMVAMEQEVLGFLDPKYHLAHDWGTNLPSRLNGLWPNILHYAEGMSSTSLMFGNQIGAHPGGVREHQIRIQIAVIVGTDKETPQQLFNKTNFWLKAFDAAYCANTKLGSRPDGSGVNVWGIWMTGGRSGLIEYAGDHYFGWLLDFTAQAQYLMRAGSAI